MLELYLEENGSVDDNSSILQLMKQDFHAAITADLWQACQPTAAVDVFHYIELKENREYF